MKFHLRLTSGKWIGGFACRTHQLDESLRNLQPIAAMWSEPVLATRIDRRGNQAGTIYRITSDDVAKVHTADDCDETCRGCAQCYRASGDTVCDKLCAHGEAL
jgi:hypothetical protein